MNDLQVFCNTAFGELNILVEDGKVLFPATESAKMLGYSDPYDAIKRHTKGSVKRRVLTEGGEQEVSFIPEGDLYRLIVRSQLPAAEQFEKWVFDEVLPTIRKIGSYSASVFAASDRRAAAMLRINHDGLTSLLSDDIRHSSAAIPLAQV